MYAETSALDHITVQPAERAKDGRPAALPVAVQSAGAGQLLALQRTAGNAAVERMLRGSVRDLPLTVQRNCNQVPVHLTLKKTAIENDDGVMQHFNDLWRQSSPHAMNVPSMSSGKLLPMATIQSRKHEYGCWVIRNTGTSALRWHDWPVGRRDESTPPNANIGPNEEVIGEFHTHPNTGEEGYDKGPSQADRTAKNANHVGCCRSQIGGYHWY